MPAQEEPRCVGCGRGLNNVHRIDRPNLMQFCSECLQTWNRTRTLTFNVPETTWKPLNRPSDVSE